MTTPEDTSGVLDLVRRWADAEQHNDADRLGGLLAEDSLEWSSWVSC
jgi:hypothetical protein